MALETRLLGSPIFELDGRPVAADTRKAAALLAYLIVEGRTRRDTLAGLLWPESPESQARAALRRTLSALRRAMGHGSVEADRQVIEAGDQVQSDVERIRRAQAAIAEHPHDQTDVCRECIPHLEEIVGVYRGDFLQGFSLRGTPMFEDWIRNVSEHYRMTIGSASERLSMVHAAEGNFRSAIEAAHRWLDLDPLREPAYRHLMLLYAWAGDKSGAIATFRRCVEVLQSELGVKPLEETAEMQEAILDDDLPPAPSVRRKVNVKTVSSQRPLADLIDRREVLGILEGIVDPAIHGRVIRVVGQSWMGKTRLLEELTTVAANAKKPVLTARGYRGETQLPYGVLSQLLAALVRGPTWADVKSLIPEWALAESARLQRLLSDTPAVRSGDGFAEMRLLDALLAVFDAVDHLLIVDDVQWVDRPSAAFFAFLARRVDDHSVDLVLAYRPDHTAGLGEVVQASDRSKSVVVELAPLTASEILGVVADTGKAEGVIAQTGGIPALVAEALAPSGSSEHRHNLRRFIESRMSELDDLASQVLTAMAVLQGTHDVDVLRETSGRSEFEVAEAIEKLMARQIVSLNSSGEPGITLGSVAELVYDQTNLVRRKLLHRRAAESTMARPAARRDAGLAMAVARHFHEGGRDQDAAEWYATAAEFSRDVFAYEAAIGAYQSAAALGYPERSQLSLGHGEALLSLGRYSQALSEFDAGKENAEAEMLALLQHRSGEALRRLGRIDQALDQFADSEAHHPQPTSLYCDWALAVLRKGDVRRASQLAAKAIETADDADSAALSRGYCVSGSVDHNYERSRESLLKALALAGDDPVLKMGALNVLGHRVAVAGDLELSKSYVTQALEIALRIGDPHRQAVLHDHLADIFHRAGETREAEAELVKAVKLFVEVEPGAWEPEIWLLRYW